MVNLSNVVLLLGYNPRAQCYAQAMRHLGYAPAEVITFGAPEKDIPRSVNCPDLDSAVFSFSPDLNETLSETIQDAGWSWTHCDADNVNDPEILSLIKGRNPEIVVYAGYGGQIVGRDLLQVIPQFLHMHCGLLPEYRGSTTIYYSWLKENTCGVSAILMNENIDEGPIVMKQSFPAPPPDADVDLFYDNTLRAHVFMKCMQTVNDAGTLPVLEEQSEDGELFFVIHPVLKHIALMQRAET